MPDDQSLGALIEHRNEGTTEADWQTVTTDRLNDAIVVTLADPGKGTGSSLADVTEASECHMCQCDRASFDRIIQHPVLDEDPESYHLRNDKLTSRPILVPKFREPANPGFLQNVSRKTPQKAARAASAIRRFSNQFRSDEAIQRPRRSKMFEMDTLRHSFESLDSEPPDGVLPSSVNALSKGEKFSWSRIRQNLGRDPPQPALTVFDQPLYRPSIQEGTRPRTQVHVPHDVFLAEIPQLPFPLISLPEAAMLQHFRRERGEEDHTEPSGSFISRPRLGTVSTTASSYRRDTSSLIRHDSPETIIPPLPPPVYCSDAPRRRRTCESKRFLVRIIANLADHQLMIH